MEELIATGAVEGMSAALDQIDALLESTAPVAWVATGGGRGSRSR